MDSRVIGEYVIPFAAIALFFVLAIGESGVPLLILAITRLLSRNKNRTPRG